jgi:hypothetical protein
LLLYLIVILTPASRDALAHRPLPRPPWCCTHSPQSLPPLPLPLTSPLANVGRAEGGV